MRRRKPRALSPLAVTVLSLVYAGVWIACIYAFWVLLSTGN